MNVYKKGNEHIDYVILESCQGQIELHRGRGGYNWKGQKGKELEWILPIKVKDNADEVLKKIYNLPEWNTVGKGRECSYDSPALRSAIWHTVFPLISVKHLPKVNERIGLSDQERMNKTKSKGKYLDDDAMEVIESDECYTFYDDVEKIVKHFGTKYWHGKVVYMNCDDAGQSAFWIYFMNNFKRLKLKEIISTRYDGSKLDFSGSLFGNQWEEFDGFIVRYDGKKLVRIPPVGSPSNFHGSYADKVCMDIATSEADVIITNPPFSKFEHFFKCMQSTGKDFICFGNGVAVRYQWTEELWKNKKIFVIPYRFDWFLSPTFKKKNALAFIFTNIPQTHTFNKIKPLKEIPKYYYDDGGILIVDKFVPNDYYKPFGISIHTMRNGVLNSGYKLLQCQYVPYLDKKRKFDRIIIIKEKDAKGKPNTAYDGIKFKEAKPKKNRCKTKLPNLFD